MTMPYPIELDGLDGLKVLKVMRKFVFKFINFKVKTREFSFSFYNADIVILCPIYAAKNEISFSYLKFAEEIIKT